MNRSLRNIVPIACLFGGVLLYVHPSALHSQASPEVDQLAARVAERIIKAQRQHVLAAGLTNCQLDLDLCTAFETSLDAKLEQAIPGVQFIKREEVVKILKANGFLSLDVYVGDVLELSASHAGAEILVTEDLKRQGSAYELSSTVFDAVKRKKLDQFRSKLALPVSDSDLTPRLLKDPETGASLIIFGGAQSDPVMRQMYPHCDKCDDPKYTQKARDDGLQGVIRMLATVTEQGKAENISVIAGLADGLTDQAIEAVRNWRFKPAVGPDGKPFAVRVPIEINYLLHP